MEVFICYLLERNQSIYFRTTSTGLILVFLVLGESLGSSPQSGLIG